MVQSHFFHDVFGTPADAGTRSTVGTSITFAHRLFLGLNAIVAIIFTKFTASLAAFPEVTISAVLGFVRGVRNPTQNQYLQSIRFALNPGHKKRASTHPRAKGRINALCKSCIQLLRRTHRKGRYACFFFRHILTRRPTMESVGTPTRYQPLPPQSSSMRVGFQRLFTKTSMQVPQCKPP